jgi:hypothetical protein
MKASTERSLFRWFHILASIPVVGYIYGPVSSIPEAVVVVRWILFPAIVLSGLWMWKGHWIKSRFRSSDSAMRTTNTR